MLSHSETDVFFPFILNWIQHDYLKSKRKSGLLCLKCCPCDATPERWRKTDEYLKSFIRIALIIVAGF